MIIILLAIVLIGALTAAIQATSQQKSHIDDETLILRANQIQSQSAEFERGITFIMQNGHSESDLRFAHLNAHTDYGDLSSDSDTSDQLFAKDGGAATYHTPPSNINDGSQWEFYGNTAMPDTGSNAAELIAVLPNINQRFCEKVNTIIGYTGQPEDSATCIHTGSSERFDDTTQFDTSPNTTDDSTFSMTPPLRGCIECTSDGSYHYFQVLMVR